MSKAVYLGKKSDTPEWIEYQASVIRRQLHDRYAPDPDPAGTPRVAFDNRLRPLLREASAYMRRYLAERGYPCLRLPL